jgi:type II secretory ATPase GspE/PulE/Tfp pilus assembly ATPase PilB-like protein
MFKTSLIKQKLKETQATAWVNDIISRGISAGASDIHIDPYREEFVVRFRVDGMLHKVDSQIISFFPRVISCLKIMANLDITEHRRPQDGHILFNSKGTFEDDIDLRVSVFPLVINEAIVIRILGGKNLFFQDFEKLGVYSCDAERLKDILQRSSGMVLSTGPGGTGKTTTLYTILHGLRSQKKNIITLEDPVEYYIEGLRQSQIRPEIGFDFIDGLKAILRQNPDVIMIGEIRDDKTAEASIRASLMGSLFLSTMHTTNSVGTIVRLLEFNLPRSFIASSLSLIIAQRLVRIICPYCIEEDKPSVKTFELSKASKNKKFFKGKGCTHCDGDGYFGRKGIFEFMFINKNIQQLIINSAPFTEIEEAAKLNGMHTLREEAVRQAEKGVTTLEEVIRVTPND